MKVQWTVAALSDLREVQRFIAQDNPKAAARMVLSIMKATEERLMRFPASGRSGRAGQTRELVIPGTDYIVPYRQLVDRVVVLRVYHAARKWPSGFD